MRILITNIRVGLRSGTEIVVRDFAQRLSERQHDVAVYTPTIGALAEELTSRGIPVVDSLLEVPFVPDVIHGHHIPCTGEAIMAFPNTPAIWICHGAQSWFDAPPRFSQVRRIFAVDETCKARLVEADGIPANQIEILPNAVDLRRFLQRPSPLPARPLRALSLVKHAGLGTLIAEACRQTGLQLESYGHGVGNPIADIEQRCAEVDIVFATARTALEAMATGAAVILIDGRGFGGLVTIANYDLGRRLNFGLGMLKAQPTSDALVDAISAYDPQDADAVSQRVRHDADLDHAILRLEDIYSAVVRESAGRVFDPSTLRREQIEFCGSWLMNLEPTGEWRVDREHMLSEHAHLNDQLTAVMNRNTDIEAQLVAQISRTAESENRLAAQLTRTSEIEGQLTAEANRIADLQDLLTKERGGTASLRDQIAERDDMISALTSQVDRSERARSVRLAKALRRLFRWKSD